MNIVDSKIHGQPLSILTKTYLRSTVDSSFISFNNALVFIEFIFPYFILEMATIPRDTKLVIIGIRIFKF